MQLKAILLILFILCISCTVSEILLIPVWKTLVKEDLVKWLMNSCSWFKIADTLDSVDNFWDFIDHYGLPKTRVICSFEH